MSIRVSGSHQRYLDAGCVLTEERPGHARLPGYDGVTMVHFYGPCTGCGTALRDVDDRGYEDTMHHPYVMDYYGPPDPTLCVGCAMQRYHDSIDLTGRMAVCKYSQRRDGTMHTVDEAVPSSWGLAFFEYRGPGSEEATRMCGECRYAVGVHGAVNVHTGRPGITDHAFTPRGPQEHDHYYCGCWGWD